MLCVIFSDPHIVVCVKPAGVLSQDAGADSVPGILREQLGLQEVFVVHRLDRHVGGVMVFAKTRKAAAELSKAVQEHRLEKQYLAVLKGVPETEEAVLEDLLYHDKTKNKTYVVKRMRKGVKDAKLQYWLQKTAQSFSLVRVQLFTGRTHQIRVQFASRKLPLAGDRKYGGKETGSSLGLWSCRLSFPHPITGELLSFSCEPPEDEPWNRFL